MGTRKKKDRKQRRFFQTFPWRGRKFQDRNLSFGMWVDETETIPNNFEISLYLVPLAHAGVITEKSNAHSAYQRYNTRSKMLRISMDITPCFILATCLGLALYVYKFVFDWVT